MDISLLKRIKAIGVAGLLGILLLTGGWRLLTVSVSDAAVSSACTLPRTPEFPSKVGLYVLAFDNDPFGQFDLGAQYDDTVKRLTDATATVPDSIVVILADLGGVGDTHLVVAVDGVSTRLDCLPTAEGSLDPALREWDTADGQSLADFLVWGRETFATPASGLVFSYIGHGNPVSPYIEEGINSFVPPIGEDGGLTAASDRIPEALSPLPSRLGVNPSLTDHHAPTTGTLSLITPHDLAVALATATNDGANPFDLVDLLHCFAASVDELVELAPYTQGIIASPNYAFFDPEMPGATFEQEFLQDVLLTYGNFHPISGHPHILMGIEADTVMDVTNNWQTVTNELLDEFDQDEATTAERMRTAYLNSIKYDTTVCEQDQAWTLAPPDALSDMKSYAIELQTAFGGQNPTLTTALSQTIDTLDGIILLTVSESGVPYFNEGTENSWQFLAGDSGVSLFTPFQTTEINGEPYLPWQSLWYTGTTSYTLTENVVISNPKPFAFIHNGEQATWADVVHRFWQVEGMRPGIEVNTFFCTAELLGVQEDAADLTLALEGAIIVSDTAQTLQVTLTISNGGMVMAPDVVLSFRPHTAPLDWLTFEAGNQAEGCVLLMEEQLLCMLGDLPPNDVYQLQLSYGIEPDRLEAPFMLEMTAEVTAVTFDPLTADNRQYIAVEVPAVSAEMSHLFLPLLINQSSSSQ